MSAATLGCMNTPAPRDAVIEGLRRGMTINATAGLCGWSNGDVQAVFDKEFPARPIAVNTERTPPHLLRLPLSQALTQVERWLYDCQQAADLGLTSSPSAPFSFDEAWIVARLAAQDLANLQGWSYDLAAAPSTGAVTVAYETDCNSYVWTIDAPVADWAGIYAWRPAHAVPPKPKAVQS